MTFQQAIDLAVQHRSAGRLDEYQKILQAAPNQHDVLLNLGLTAFESGYPEISVDFTSRALAVKSDYPEAHNNLGVVLKTQGKLDESVASYRKAIAIEPNFVDAHHNLGNAFLALDRLDDAVASYDRALAIAPENIGANFNLGNTFKKMGRLEQAVAKYLETIAIKPDYAEVHKNLGNLYHEQRRLDEAAASYQKALAIKPDYADAHNNFGALFQEQGKLDEAITCFEKALAIMPQYADAHGNLALALYASRRLPEAYGHFERQLDLVRGDNPIDPHHQSFHAINKAKMIHDLEQFRYLASLGSGGERFAALAEVYAVVDGEIEWPDGDGTLIRLSDDHRERLGDTYNRPFHMVEAPAMAGSSLRSDIDVAKVTANYYFHEFGMTYFDGLLSQEALASLRSFLLGSTIWFDFIYQRGYMGAMLKDGLACPLLLQIANDLRTTFPDIFKDHQLTQLWAYKYDSRLSGIEIHADFAAINVNFWVTPDKANLNPETGGLVVYDVEAPLDWNFNMYNKNAKGIRKHLADHESGKIVVPYGENRIVLFNSNLFHETDAIDFKPGYKNRRINVTMLFGKRED